MQDFLDFWVPYLIAVGDVGAILMIAFLLIGVAYLTYTTLRGQ